MCGIFGIACLDGTSGLAYSDGRFRSLLNSMGQELAHRGPDDQGIFIFSDPNTSIGVGARRLSIIDVANGRQPIQNQDGSLTLVCNGEIYNYRELRRTLIAKGHRFKTESDAEVIIPLYEEYGWKCVYQLRGMFAFAIWDGRERKLVLARDRLGIKPLFFHAGQRQLTFASEIRGLLPALNETPALKPEALLRLLTLKYIPAPDSAFAGIQKVLPGTVLIASRKGLEAHRYWTAPDAINTWPQGTEAELRLAIREHLQEAVTSHLMSDVPVGAFLSGGIDSTSVLALVRQVFSGPFSTFSVGFDGPPDFTELNFARLAARRYDTEHHEVVVTPGDVIRYLPKIIEHLDEPLADPAVVPTYLLSRLAAQFVKVVLTGEGADELFGGYRRYHFDHLVSWYRYLPKRLQTLIPDWLGNMPIAINRRAVQALHALAQTSPLKRHINWVRTFAQQELVAIASDAVAAAREEADMERFFSSYFHKERSQEAVTGMLLADISTWLPDDLLVKVDRISMAVSLEARVPYLDHRLVEMVMSLPASLRLKGGPKRLLKSVVADLIPTEILGRKKMGFEMPLAYWMRGSLREYMSDLLKLEGPPGFLNQTVVEQFWGEHLKGIQDRSRQLWSILIVKLWHQHMSRRRAQASC